MSFINLTNDSGVGIIINVKYIIKIRKRRDHKGSLVVQRENNLTNVNETLAEITALLKKEI